MRDKKSKPPAIAIHRRDASGHLDPNYAAGLRVISKASAGPKDGPAFLKGPRSEDSLAEELGEDFVHGALSGADELQNDHDMFVTEETGGPFVITSGATEFAYGDNPSSPKRATRGPFPRT
jgi:hypothetical protein